MAKKIKVKRNNPCPCLSGEKYKNCCLGKLDWNKVYKDGQDTNPHLSLKGRNLLFFEKIAEALQFDSKKGFKSLVDYKRAFTPNAVKSIHEAVLEIWPPDIDINNVLSNVGIDVSGLYIGDYRTEFIMKGIVRHSIYANKILVVDPFIYPYSVKDNFNPILKPNQFRSQTLKNVNLWLELIEWIDAGIVEIIRTPADFDRKLNWDSMERQEQKFKENQELRKAMEESIEEISSRNKNEEMVRYYILSAPNTLLEHIYYEIGLDKNDITIDQFITYINKKRQEDSDFLEPLGKEDENGEYHIYSSGANYEIAKLTSNLTGSYLVTDINSKWKEIEIDRRNHNAENKEWTPFAKSLQNLKLKYLNNLRLEHALKLRKEERLEGLRVFLKKVWKSACSDDEFSEINAKLLADELKDEIKKAEVEWEQINLDLYKMLGTQWSALILATGPLIESGYADFLATAFALSSSISYLTTRDKKKSFPDKFPAAFFMKIK